MAGAVAERRVADRRSGRPGRRRRCAAALLRHHPRRVPAREDEQRAEHPRVAGGGRVRRGHRRGRPDRRPARLPLAVLAADDRDGARGAWRPWPWSRSRPSAHQAGSRCCRRCCSPSWLVALLLGLSEGNTWGWGSARSARSLRGSARAGGGVGRGRDAGPGPADRHADDARARGLDRQRGRCLRRVRACSPPSGSCPSCCRLRPRPATASGRRITESGHMLLPSAAASFLMGFTTAPLIRVFGARIVVVDGMPRHGRGLRVDRAVARARPGSCTPPRRCRGSAPGWSSPASPAS